MENNNSVCFISKIISIQEIADAQNIELITINGWTSVTQKGVHKLGNLVLCIITDAVIPIELATKWGVDRYLGKNGRVRTVKLKGVYSECILIPLYDVPCDTAFDEGVDLGETLGIIKYEVSVKLPEQIKLKKVYFKLNEIYKFKMWKSYFNYLYRRIINKFRIYHKDNINFNEYYKFPNQKNTPYMFNEEDIVSITRKIHGSNARFAILKKNRLSLIDKIKKLFGNEWIEYQYVYGSHRVQKRPDIQGYYSSDIWKRIDEKHKINEKLWDFVKMQFYPEILGNGIIIYGEIYGPGVQGNHYNYGLSEIDFIGFDVELDGEYLDEICQRGIFDELNLPKVEVLYKGVWSKEIQDKHVGGFIDNTSTPHEGVVVRCITGDRKKISKVINSDYKIFNDKNNIDDSGH